MQLLGGHWRPQRARRELAPHWNHGLEVVVIRAGRLRWMVEGVAEAARGFDRVAVGVDRTDSSDTASYRPPRSPSRNAILTRRSSPLWNDRITMRPPGRSRRGAASSSRSSASSSPLTRMRIAWNVRAAGCRPVSPSFTLAFQVASV